MPTVHALSEASQVHVEMNRGLIAYKLLQNLAVYKALKMYFVHKNTNDTLYRIVSRPTVLPQNATPVF